MRWRGGRRSSNIEDRRGRGGLGGGLRMPGRRGGGGGLRIGGLGGIVVLLIGLFFGVDVSSLLGGGAGGMGGGLGGGLGGGMGGGTVVQQRQAPPTGLRSNDEQSEFIAVMLGTTEEVWTDLFARAGSTYRTPTLVLFEDRVTSACGAASSASGPFYCPGDSKLYIDLGFFRVLERRMGAGGDFAQAYVLAHEVGHHVQNLLGVSMDVQRRQRRLPRAQANALSVLTELQADCYAGVWAHHAHEADNGVSLEPGDVEEGMNAAARIGDDALGHSNPESFTHGSSEQRQRWLYRGMETGDPQACDTFSAGA